MFLIDGSSFCYRAFYAIRNLSTSKGQPTNAVYGVVAMLRKLVADERPDYLAVAFDLPKPTFRHLRFEGYKEHRKPMPDALVDQLPWIRAVLAGFRIPIFELEGYEADDVLGTVAVSGAKKGLEIYLVTGDKDMLQLVGKNVRVYRPVQDGHEIQDEKSLKERWGLRPDQVVDVMALMGDAVDAIPGVKGIGEKTAVELIQKFGSVEDLLKKLESPEKAGIRPAVARAIREGLDHLKMSRELAVLDTAVPLSLDWEGMKLQEPDRAALGPLFQSLEFRALAKEFAPDRSAYLPEVKVCSTKQGMQAALAEARRAGSCCLVLEKGEGPAMQAELLAAGLAWGEDNLCAAAGKEAIAQLRPLLEEAKVAKVIPNLKEALILLFREGVSPRGRAVDPCIVSYLLDPTRPSHRLEDLAIEFLARGVESPEPARAAAAKALAAWEMTPKLEKEAKEKSLDLLLEEVELPLARVLARMEFHGIAVDRTAFAELSKRIAQSLEGLTREITRLAGAEFNLNSPKQLGQVLFERLKLPVIKRTKTGASTDEEVLRRLSPLHDLPKSILEYRELAKLSSTYVEAIPRMVHPETERVHACFNQTVTATGRLSSSNPNLQNIPIRTELGRQIRRGFVSSHRDGRILAADYSQIELRILAHLSEDEALSDAFRKGRDIHRATAAQIFGMKPEEIETPQRAVAKTINFGIVYGMSSFGLSKELGVDPAQAQEFIDQYFARYPKVKSYLERSLQESRERGYCITLFNRRRNLPELKAKELSVRQFAERMAINAPIQGSAADLIKIAMVQLDRTLEQKGFAARMVCQVHDELLFDLPGEELEPVQALVKEMMEAPELSGKPVRLRVPIEVNLRAGRNWYEASKG